MTTANHREAHSCDEDFFACKRTLQCKTRLGALSSKYLAYCTSLQVLFDHVGCLKKYDAAEDILREFFELRLRYYGLRKDWLTGLLGAESAKLSNQARFILEKIEGKIVIGKLECNASDISEQSFVSFLSG